MINITQDFNKFWEQITDKNEVILYGAGSKTQSISSLLKRANVNWNYVIDCAEAKNNSFYEDKKCYCPQKIKEIFKDKNIYIIIMVDDINGALATIAKNFSDATVLTPKTERRMSKFSDMFAPVRYQLLKRKDFTIFSNNCFATRVYQLVNVKYQSPTIANIIKPEDYLKFCQNFEYYINQELKFKQYSSTYFPDCTNPYPEFTLDDISIHFVHSNDPDKTAEDWNRRKERINKDNLFMVFDTMNYRTNPKILNDFLKINYGKKLIFQHSIALPIEHSIFCQDCQGVFNLSNITEWWFDLVGWLNNETEY